MRTNIRIIGLDWATEDARRAVAAVDIQEDRATLMHLGRCSKRNPALTIVGDLLANSDHALLAIDAPLGWPLGMRTGLESHVAGQPVSVAPDEMFARTTDRFVHDRLRFRPMEVGANLIARVAHSALVFLDQLRKTTRRPIPLLWSPTELDGCAAIEVYPSATRRVSRCASPAEELSIDLPSNQYENEHVRDALWCAVAGMHFMRDECEGPSDMTVARREGWIWFCKGASG